MGLVSIIRSWKWAGIGAILIGLSKVVVPSYNIIVQPAYAEERTFEYDAATAMSFYNTLLGIANQDISGKQNKPSGPFSNGLNLEVISDPVASIIDLYAANLYYLTLSLNSSKLETGTILYVPDEFRCHAAKILYQTAIKELGTEQDVRADQREGIVGLVKTYDKCNQQQNLQGIGQQQNSP